MLLSREISIPSLKVLRSPSLPCFASTGWVTPALTGSTTIPAQQPVKDRTHSCAATPKAGLYTICKPLRSCISKEV